MDRWTADRIEARLKASAPETPGAVRRAVLSEANRKLSAPRSGDPTILGSRAILAASLLACAGVFWTALPSRENSPGTDRRTGAQERTKGASSIDSAEVDRLVVLLGDPDPAARDAAGRSLLALGPGVMNHLKRFLVTRDAEIRGRLEELIRDASLLPVEEPLRKAVRMFDSSDAMKAKQGLSGLLSADRKQLHAALEICRTAASARLRHRTDQLLRLLSRDCDGSIRYGLIGLEPVVLRNDPVAALEVWINDSKKSFYHSSWMGSRIDHFENGQDPGLTHGESTIFGQRHEEDRDAAFDPVAPGRHQVFVWSNLLSNLPGGTPPGRYEIRHSAAILKTGGSGQLENEGRRTPSVEVTVR